MIAMNVLSCADDEQRARLKEEQQKQLEGDVDMAEGDLIARVRDGGREVTKPRYPCHFPRSILRSLIRYRAHYCIVGSRHYGKGCTLMYSDAPAGLESAATYYCHCGPWPDMLLYDTCCGPIRVCLLSHAQRPT